MDKSKILKLQIIEEEINEIDNKLKFIEKDLSNIKELKNDLKEIKKTKEDIAWVELKKGIYMPIKIIKGKLLIRLTNNEFIKKPIDETINLIDENLKKLIETKSFFLKKFEDLESQINSLIKDKEK